jgi:hypothetical protein
LLLPHLKEVELINKLGEELISGPSGLFAATAGLSQRGLERRYLDTLGSLDWKGWRPRPPLSERHRYARAGKLYWDILTDHVDRFVNEHQDEIARHWFEVHRFSSDLVSHSVPYRPREIDELDDWSGVGEIDNPDIPRVEVGGAVRALRPVSSSDEMTGGDLANLKELCRFVIFLATFAHSYGNAYETDDGGEIRYTSLGLRNGSMRPESDDSIFPQPVDASYQLLAVQLLARNFYGSLVSNEDGDIPPGLVALVRARKPEFDAMGFDVTRVLARVNI